jgi:solute carrier family 6 GABA transporter-like protein 1
MYRSGDVVCFSRISHRLRGLGLASVFGAFMVNTYYSVLLGWIVVYFFRSFNPNIPWIVKDPMLYFNQDILMLPADGRTSDPYMIVGSTLGATIVVWLIMYFSLWKGVGLTGKIVYFTMTMPVILIVVLFIRGVTLPGASTGILQYIGQFDSRKLADPLIWSESIGQVFFSIGVAFGTMTAYASYNSKHQNPAVDSCIVAISNSIYEIFCGFVVFSTIGYLQTIVKNKEVAVGSFGLAFGTYPLAFSTLPGAQFWNILFFLTLFILGIDSGFSLLESGATVLLDSRTFKGKSRETILAAMCFAGFLISILFCTEVGIYAMDAVDYFLNNVAM